MNYLEIEKVIGREIIDSRGNPTVEAEVHLVDGTVARGAAPSGASTGEFEALELRDGDKSKFGGKGVSRAVENINTTINSALVGMDAGDTYAIDQAMIQADGTKDKSNVVPFSWRSEWKQTSCSNDEHCKWRVSCTFFWTGCAGVHDHAGGSAVF